MVYAVYHDAALVLASVFFLPKKNTEVILKDLFAKLPAHSKSEGSGTEESAFNTPGIGIHEAHYVIPEHSFSCLQVGNARVQQHGSVLACIRSSVQEFVYPFSTDTLKSVCKGCNDYTIRWCVQIGAFSN